ncbi:hypothetical protein ACXZ65_37570 [Streptomyces aculeolatus]
MRRIGTALGALTLAAMMGGTLTGSAWAANGTLRVGFDTYQNPSGCYDSKLLPMLVGNQTDKTAVVYNGKAAAGSSSVKWLRAAMAPSSSARASTSPDPARP